MTLAIINKDTNELISTMGSDFPEANYEVKVLDIPEGKTLKAIDPETGELTFYETEEEDIENE